MTSSPPSSDAVLDPAFVAAFRAGTLTEAQAAAFAAQDPGLIQFQLLQLSAAIGESFLRQLFLGARFCFVATICP